MVGGENRPVLDVDAIVGDLSDLLAGRMTQAMKAKVSQLTRLCRLTKETQEVEIAKLDRLRTARASTVVVLDEVLVEAEKMQAQEMLAEVDVERIDALQQKLSNAVEKLMEAIGS